MAQQAFQAALQANERVRKSTEIPPFYGRPEKDTMKPVDFIARFETASRIAGWVPVPVAGQPPNTARKCEEFYVLLRDKAMKWWDSLKNERRFDYENWDLIKQRFLQTYAPRYTARTACLSFSDLVQQSGETVPDFYLRVSQAFKLLQETIPPAIYNNQDPVPDFDVALAQRAQLATDYARICRQDGIEEMGRYLMQQLFMAGLKEELRVKTMELNPASLAESYERALELDTIMKDKRGAKPMITSVNTTEPEEEEVDEDDDEAELLIHINAARALQGKKPVRFIHKNNKRFANVTCRYCKKKGHFQKECMKRKRENGDMVDAQGKPIKINPLEDEESEQEDEEANIQSIVKSFYDNSFGINSIQVDTSSDEENVNEEDKAAETHLERQAWLEDTSDQPTKDEVWNIYFPTVSVTPLKPCFSGHPDPSYLLSKEGKYLKHDNSSDLRTLDIDWSEDFHRLFETSDNSIIETEDLWFDEWEAMLQTQADYNNWVKQMKQQGDFYSYEVSNLSGILRWLFDGTAPGSIPESEPPKPSYQTCQCELCSPLPLNY
jgi:hypothetical protein